MSQRGRPENRGEQLGKALARALSGATLGERWIVEGLIGVGGMGVVLGATDGPDGAPVVAKVIAPQLAPAQWAAFVKASRREALALRRLSDRRPPSPYIVRFFDEGEVEVPILSKATGAKDETIPIRYLILEYVDGGPHGTTLHDRIHRSLKETGKGFAPQRARRILRHIARALGDIHAERLIHRDLKPTNVLVAGPPGEEVAKVTDFGIVRVQDDASHAGVVAVSVGYSAPEQYVPGNTQVGTQSDIFSLGALAYEVLTGCALFPQEAQASLSAARRPHRHSLLDAPTVHGAYQHAVEQVQAIDKLIAQATWPKLEGRPHDVRELWRALDAQLAALETIVAPTSEVGTAHRMSLGTMPAARAEIIAGIVPAVPPGKPSPEDTAPREEPWHWRVRGVDQGRKAVTDVAFGEDGKALAVGAQGVRFWDGGAWLEIPLPDGLSRDAFTCVARLDPDRYALGGPQGLLAFLTRGSWQLLRGTDPTIEYTALWGNEQGMLVAAGRRPGRSAVVWCARGGEWLAPKKMPGVRALWSLAPHSAGVVLAAGDAMPREASPTATTDLDLLVGALVSVNTTNGDLRDLRPLDGEMPRLSAIDASRFGEAVVVGAEGFAARVGFASKGVEIRPERVETRHDLMGARFDAAAQVSAAAPGRIVARAIADDGRPVWRRLWWGAGDGPSLIRVYASGDRLL
ncbi:MAG: serine/threonine protein kinase, partial [Sandaracinaceae bacterium]|nr:serine/threonine protein kinase [Sandaracinaceae bacterium]